MPIGRRSSGGSSFSMSAQSAFEMSFRWCALTMTLRASSSSGIFCSCSAGSRSKIVTTFSNGFRPSGACARLASRAAFSGSTCSIRSTMIATPVWPCLPVTGSTRSSSFCATSIADPGVSVRRIAVVVLDRVDAEVLDREAQADDPDRDADDRHGARVTPDEDTRTAARSRPAARRRSRRRDGRAPAARRARAAPAGRDRSRPSRTPSPSRRSRRSA